MRARNVVLCTLVFVLAMGLAAQAAFAETRTLTTTLVISIRPAMPAEAQTAPPAAKEALDSALPQSMNERFIQVDPLTVNGISAPRYTMSEKL